MIRTSFGVDTLPIAVNGVELPERDGKPMGETQWHIVAIMHLYQALTMFFQAIEQVYVGADMLLYYEQGPPAAFVVPDVFVVKGVSKAMRRVYRLWEERVAPCVIFEITSRSTKLEDLGNKRGLYQELGVREYFIFDPLGEYLHPPLRGYQLADGVLAEMPLQPDDTLVSQELGLRLKPESALLRLVNLDTGEKLMTADELAIRAEEALEYAQAESERAQAEAERAQAEAERAARAEAELERLRAEIARLRRSPNA